MSGIFLLVYGPITLTIASIVLVRLLVRPKLKVPATIYTGKERSHRDEAAGRQGVQADPFEADDTRNVYMLKAPK